MKTLKATFLFCLALLSQVVFAGEWTHVNLQKDGYSVRVSYTRQYLPATIGSRGGMASAKLFVDVYANSQMRADSVSILSRSLKLNETSPFHAWAEVIGRSYADNIWIGETYDLKLVVDGREVCFKFKAQ